MLSQAQTGIEKHFPYYWKNSGSIQSATHLSEKKDFHHYHTYSFSFVSSLVNDK